MVHVGPFHLDGVRAGNVHGVVAAVVDIACVRVVVKTPVHA